MPWHALRSAIARAIGPRLNAMIGTTLGRYRIVAKLGEGGMGSVWRAEDPALERTVALKLLSPALWSSDTARQRFLREARAASQLDHPNIATVYDVGESEGRTWIAYQFVQGETVAARTGRGPLPLAEAVHVTRDVAAALAHAHARGVLHRDVTAGNVMVAHDGHAVLVDFGLARPEKSDQLTTTGAVMGTEGYVAPEIMKGGPADERSDLYGLGVVLYRMLTGQMPFEGGVPEALLYRVLNEPAPPTSDLRPEVPVALEHVAARLLQREPADRYESAAELDAELGGISIERSPNPIDLRRRALARRWRALTQGARRLGRIRIGATALITAALVAAALWAAAKLGWLPGTHRGPPVIAVLPFDNTSPDPEEAAYLSEGLGSELATRLGQGSHFRVLPWATSRRTGAANESLTQIAKRLHVDALLVGSFVAQGDRLRVTASLVDGRSGVQRWSQSFDQLLTDLLSVQANIALDVAGQLAGSLDAKEHAALARQPTANSEAYDHYLHGVRYLQSDDYNERMLAGPFFDRALELDSTLAAALVGRAAWVMDQHFRGTSGGVAALRSAESDLRRALALDPTLMQARRGLVGLYYEYGQAELMLGVAADAAKQGDHDVEGLLTRGRACVLAGLPAAGVPILERALQLDASNQEAAWYRTVALVWAGRNEAAVEAGKDYVRRFGEDPEIYLWMGLSASGLGRFREAGAYQTRSLELFGDENSNLYSVPFVVGYLLSQHQATAARQLIAHWLPILNARLETNPDNFRVLGALVALEAYAGNRRRTDELLDVMTSQLKANPDMNAGVLVAWALPALVAGRNEAGLHRLLFATSSRELANLFFLNNPDWFQGPPESNSALQGSPDFQRLHGLVRARLDELTRRYIPLVGLRPGLT